MLDHIEEKIQLDVLRAEGRVKAAGNDVGKRKKKLSSELGRINKMFEKGRITEEYYDERYEAISKQCTISIFSFFTIELIFLPT